MERNPWVTHNSEIVYDNAWITVEHDTVTTPGGSDGIYGVVRFKNRAVAVVPIDDDGNTWLVGQYRYALGTYSWEVPAGGCPVDESIEDTARRELVEETGIVAKNLSPIFANVHLSNSVTDEAAFAFVATDLTVSTATPEDTEDLALQRLPLDDAIEMVLKGTITDAFSVMALLRIHADRVEKNAALAN